MIHIEVLRLKADEERAALQLACVARPDRLAILVAEARRRGEMFEEKWRTDARGSRGETALTAGLRSVTDDVARGRL